MHEVQFAKTRIFSGHGITMGLMATSLVAYACTTTEDVTPPNTGGTTASGGQATGGKATGGSSGCPMELVGWAAVSYGGFSTTTGGGNATPVRPTSASEIASLAGDSTPRVIEISGTFDVGLLNIKSNKTLVGIGPDATLEGGFAIVGTQDAYVSNVIVRNLNIHGRGFGGTNPGDSAAVRFAHHVWIDHSNIWDGPDGNLDVTRGADYVTVSWTKFWYTQPEHDHRLSSLVSGGGEADNGATDAGYLNTTWHHNWWAELVQERMPRYLWGKGHIYNNYYTATGNNYCVRIGSGASVLIENNYFRGVEDPHEFAEGDAFAGHVAAPGNIYDNTNGNQATGGPGTPFDSPYTYTADPASIIPTLVPACVGPR
jgi:pectate lyase